MSSQPASHHDLLFATPPYPLLLTTMSAFVHCKSGEVQVSNCQAIEGCIQGNLCRCTGYRPIHDAEISADSRSVIPLF